MKAGSAVQEFLERIVETRVLSEEVEDAVAYLMEGEVNDEELTALVRVLLRAPQREEAEYKVGGILS